jgi:hypothetical protein
MQYMRHSVYYYYSSKMLKFKLRRQKLAYNFMLIFRLIIQL